MSLTIIRKAKVSQNLSDRTVLWRYLDAAKFLHLLHTQTLFFARGDQFEDKYEGAFTRSIKHAIESSYQNNEIAFSYDEFKKRLRERVFINCWRKSSNDSMAMWNLYGRSSAAVAITTTVGQLRNAIDEAKLHPRVSITEVEYVKHWRDPQLKISPYSNVFAYKLVAYDFEQEVRVLIDRFDEEFDSPVPETGMPVGISLKTLLRSIVVSPEAEPWFLELVEGVVKKYDVAVSVHRSKLAFEPV